MTKTSTREEIIRKGAELIHAQGYNATGLQQILQAVGIPKGSFYFYFKSKEDFGLEIIDYFSAMISGIITHYLGDKKMPPVKRLEKLLEFFENAFQQNGHTMGCPIGNLSLELAGTNERLRVHLKDVIGSLIAQIESCLEEAKRDKSIPASLNTADAACLIFYGFEGAILHMKVVKNIEPFRAFRSYLTGYFENIKA
ncbi:MAG: TetR family transcriptional regulator [Deltaproteobacteria bacterium HGW-Deltaproteobacteria-2]|jgi:TetR/AcrR family transcriptional repressor of nem operon|nr:MAG: TetR family transcriptional regulator [Deltaproteobacteria bacterium HGW-Deltaproteobacteria-2]